MGFRAFPSLFTTYPEAMHKASQIQSTNFNSELMKKIVLEKRKNNHKFTQGKCMNEAFKFFNNKHDL